MAPADKPALGRHPTADAGDVDYQGLSEASLPAAGPAAHRELPQARSTWFRR